MGKNDLLSYGSIADVKKEEGNRHIVCLSGGASSAWVAWWAKNNIKGEVIYYFNDTHWEHPDLYRFLGDIERVLKINITEDPDERSPEDVFYDQHVLGNNRIPVCSRVLKAEKLQKFIKKHDTIYFGIDMKEIHRAARITPIYARHECYCKFPIIDNLIRKDEIFNKITELGIEIPQMYKDGFTHNNCNGGCVRAGEKQWSSLLRVYPDVYADRERVEIEFNEKVKPKKYATILKDISLTELREEIEKGIDMDFGEDEYQGECFGLCGRMY